MLFLCPLCCLLYTSAADQHALTLLKEHAQLIADELNVKEVQFTDDEHQFVTLKAKPNFRVLGKKVGKLMRAVQLEIDALNQENLDALLRGQTISLFVEDQTIAISPEEVEVERTVHSGIIAANAGSITIALETSLNDELLAEGFAREIVNKINTMRRELGFAVSDRIKVIMEAPSRVQESFELYRDYICNEVLAVDVQFAKCEGSTWDLNGESAKINISIANTGSKAV